ncbi:MAG: FAD-dependent monooxygenase [Gemmatimonadota bacterium]
MRSDVLIAGAGPAGSALAIRLARLGVSVTLVDRAVFPREKICSEYMSPEAVRHLELLGVLTELESSGGGRLTGTTVIGPRGARLTGLFARAGTPFRPTGLSLPRRVLDETLVRSAVRAGAVLREREQVTDLVVRDGAVRGVVVRESNGTVRTLNARLVVGADGLRSVVARAVGRRRHGTPARIAFVAHVANVAGLGEVAEMHVTRAGYVGLNPLGGGIANVAVVVPLARAAAARGRAEAFWLDVLDSIPTVRGRIDPRLIVRRVLVTGPFAAWSERVVAAGAVLIGDAADFFDPFTGEGIYSALKAAEMAAGAILPALALPGTPDARRLAPYAAERRRAFLGKWAVERMIGYAMLAPWLFERAVERLERRGLADTFIGVTGDILPAGAVLNPRVLAAMVW